MKYRTIAAHMNVSVKTINGYTETLFKKFNVNSRTAMVVYAIENKLISI